jgi:hypothetical protein
MAQYDYLPIYKKAFDLALYFERIVKNFSRYNKYTLGTDLRNKSREICVCIAKANSLVDKREVLKDLVVLVEELKMIVRLCKEAKVFHNFNSYIYSTGLVVDLAKQSQAWLNSQNN